MADKKWETYKQLLLEQKKTLIGQAMDHDEDIVEVREEQASDPLDLASKTSSLEMMSVLEHNERRVIEELDLALEKIDDGSYGTCEDCGETIGTARLEAMPTARLCIECKAQQESGVLPDHVEPLRRRVRKRKDMPLEEDEE